MSTSAVSNYINMRVLVVKGRVSRGARTELVNAEDQDGLVDLEAQDLGLDELERLSVDLDESFTGLCSFVSVFRSL
jgi:hypothetical protein